MSAHSDNVRDVVLTGTRALVGIAARSLVEVSDDVSLPQFRVLVLLHGHGSMAMSELAASLDVNPSTVTRVCDVLVTKKLIRRRPPKDDRRGVCAELTAKGRRLVDGVMSRRSELIDDALSRMSRDGRKRLAAALAEFAEAAGEVSDHAWVLGWQLDARSPDPNRSRRVSAARSAPGR